VVQVVSGANAIPPGLILDDTITLSTDGGRLTLELFSKYPLPPGIGPAIQDQLLAQNLSTYTASMSGSMVGVIPVMLTATTPGATPNQGDVVVSAVDPTTGSVLSFTVTVLPTTTPTTTMGTPGVTH
jgi:hypothetical protein